MKEPSLVPAKGDAKDFALRFFWLRSFHDPISIRIWRTGTGYRVRAVRMVKLSHSGPAPIAEDTTRDLKPEEWAEVTRLMNGKIFWTPLSEEEQGAIPTYWFGFHPHQKDAIVTYNAGYIAFGCGNAETLLAIPAKVFLK